MATKERASTAIDLADALAEVGLPSTSTAAALIQHHRANAAMAAVLPLVSALRLIANGEGGDPRDIARKAIGYAPEPFRVPGVTK